MKDYPQPLDYGRFSVMVNVIRCKKPTIKTALDVGCNMGFFSRLMIKKGLEVIGLELDRKFAKLAWSNLGDLNFNLVIGDASYLPLREQIFDFIVCGEVMEHVLHPNLLLRDCNRSLKNNGELIISTPNAAGLWSVLFDKILFMFYKLKVGGESKAGQQRQWGKDQHISLFTYDSLRGCLNASGFTAITVYEREGIGITMTLKVFCKKFNLRFFDHVLDVIYNLELKISEKMVPKRLKTGWIMKCRKEISESDYGD
jgi:SAM-dependent methyltransferase